MNEHERQGDPAFDRLVAADPAKRAPDPVESVLRAKVDALVAGSGSGPLAEVRAPAEPAGSGQADELAARRHRRRTPWLVAAAVAGIVAAGGGGYLVGESGSGTPTVAADQGEAESAASPSPLAVPDRAEGELETQSGTEAEGVQPLDAGGELSTATRLVFHAGVGLSDAPRTAEVRSGSESLGAYPVVSEVEAVERLSDPRFAGTVLGPSEAQPAGRAAAPAPGGAITWPVQDVTIVSAALTEVRYTLPDGTVLHVPAYDLADATGNGWTVMAVDEELLDFTP